MWSPLSVAGVPATAAVLKRWCQREADRAFAVHGVPSRTAPPRLPLTVDGQLAARQSAEPAQRQTIDHVPGWAGCSIVRGQAEAGVEAARRSSSVSRHRDSACTAQRTAETGTEARRGPHGAGGGGADETAGTATHPVGRRDGDHPPLAGQPTGHTGAEAETEPASQETAAEGRPQPRNSRRERRRRSGGRRRRTRCKEHAPCRESATLNRRSRSERRSHRELPPSGPPEPCRPGESG